MDAMVDWIQETSRAETLGWAVMYSRHLKSKGYSFEQIMEELSKAERYSAERAAKLKKAIR